MAIKMVNVDDKNLLSIEGELTIYTAAEYKKYLVENFVADKELEVDLDGVDEIDTCGLQLLAALSKQLADNGSEIKIIATSDIARDALDLSRLVSGTQFIIEGERCPK